MEAQVGHLRDGYQVDSEVERQDREDLVSVHLVPLAVDGEHAVAVSIEGEAEIRPGARDDAREQRQIGRAAAFVDVRPVRRVPDHGDLGAEPRESGRCGFDHGAVRAVQDNAQARERRAEPVADQVDVACGQPLGPGDYARRAGLGRCVEKRFDRLLVSVLELPATVEELDPVVRSGIVGGGDDGASLLGQKRYRRGGKHAAERDVGAARGEPARERPLECGSGRTRVTADQDTGATAPARKRAS